jgi:hypothetical protein
MTRTRAACLGSMPCRPTTPQIERARAAAARNRDSSLRWLELEPAQPAPGSLAASLGAAAEADFGARTGIGVEQPAPGVGQDRQVPDLGFDLGPGLLQDPAGADGRRHRPPVPHAVPTDGRGRGRFRDGHFRRAAVAHRQVAPPDGSRRRVVAARRADRRRRRRDDGGGRATERRRGREIIDLNMGCPAKKVCNKAAGSALLRDEALVAQILAATVAAVDVPVTLKMRTGWIRTTGTA